ncbi:hypothetical protein [Cupriavidus taiwanensis]|uniref:Uncharacterized protein n=1 Tax=Cupriavidus taiwanensis TaxID=164546 RepID=A0A375JCJ9_9BURK|nr:hypothetical protein [Cupriavidus taiwanensis]SPS02281.1 hypothetical protein CBM2634_P30025 [Cupriavidus taiwanensis]
MRSDSKPETSGSNEGTYLHSILIVLRRVMQVFIVIPASIVGAVLIFLALTGQAPVKTAVLAVHTWAEALVRPAPQGAVLVADCGAELEGLSKLRRPAICTNTAMKVVPAAAAADAASREVSALYGILVLMSFGLLLAMRPGRRFFGVPSRS